MNKRERTTRIWVTRLVTVVSVMVALFALVFSLFSNHTTKVYGLSTEVSNENELLSALESSEYDEIIVTRAITLSNGTVLDGDLDDDGNRKIIRATTTGTTDQGVINSTPSNYTIFYVAQNATVHINNCIIKGGGTTAIINGTSQSSTNNNSTLYIDKCQISNSGSASSQGGGIKNTVGCKLVLTNSSIFRNVAEFGAGFQNNRGTFIMDNCSVSENRSLGQNGGGGGGENTGNEGNGTNAYMYILNSTIANNTSSEIGGGINNCKQGYLYVINSTIAGNATTNGTYSGAGIGNNSSTLECINCILLDNVYLSSTSEQEQDAYLYGSGSVTLEGCVYGTVTGSSTQLANSIDVDETCYQVQSDDSVFAATKTGSVVNPNGQGEFTYNQVALVTDENGVTYAPLDSNSKAIASNSSLTPIKVEFDYSNLNNIIFNTGEDCSITTEAPTTIGGGSALSSLEKMATVTVFVNDDFNVDGGTIYGDSYIVGSNSATDITVSATPVSGKENESVIWTLVNQKNNSLEVVSTKNPYTIDTSLSSTIMNDSWDSSKNSYDIVLQPITLSLAAEADDGAVNLSWTTDWSNTYCAGYQLSNSITSYEVYYGIVNDFNAPSTTYFGSFTGNSATVNNLSNGTAYYFFVVPKFGNDSITGETCGYVSETPKETNQKTYVLADSIEDGEEYLVVNTKASGTAKALTTSNNTTGTFTTVTVQLTQDGTPYIKTEASTKMLWGATANGNYFRLKSGNYYIAPSNRRVLYTTGMNLTVSFTNNGVSLKNYSQNYYLDLSGNNPNKSTSASYVYLYRLKTTVDAPTTITAKMQSIIGQDSGTISGISTLMEYSTNGTTWTSCTGTTMNNVPVGKYYFRYKETGSHYASQAVTIIVEEKKVTNISIKTSPTLSYVAKDSLDLSDMVVTVVYNDDTTTNVQYSDFTSQDSSVYQRSDGVITASLNNGLTLECSHNGEKITVSLDGFSATTLALQVSHNLTHVSAKDAACEETGNYEYYVCESCGKVYDKNHTETTISNMQIEAVGHSYGTPTYIWSSDYKTCTAEVVCLHDSSHVIRETVNTTSIITTNPTCENFGIRTYTATFTNSLFTSQTNTESIDSLGHDYDYSNGIWTWHNNYYVTVVFICKNDSSHTVSYTATIESAVTKEASCEDTGIRTYTATVTIDGVNYSDTKEEEIPAVGHNYGTPTYTWSSDYSTCTATKVCYNDNSHIITETVNTTSEVTLSPSCTNTGIRTYTAVFTNSDFTSQTTTRVVEALGHDYDYEAGIWNWDSIYYVTLTFVCKNDSSHTEVYQANITNEETLSPTCENAGIRTYTATVVLNGITYTSTKEEEIASIGHSYGTPTFTWSSDYSTCTAEVVCLHDSSHVIRETVSSIASIDVEATCEDAGRGLFRAKFTNELFYDQVIYTVIEPLGHDYQITYEWNDNSSVTAIAVCSHDSSHIITETVEATATRVEPTCLNDGSITYQAQFENELFEMQENVVVLEALGHNYGDITYVWASDNLSVTATRVCQNDNSHIETETVATTSVTTNPTCTTTGLITYTAIFTNGAFSTQTKEIEIPALGHNPNEAVRENDVLPTCEEDGSYDLVIYCDVCGEELSRETIIVEALGHTEALAVKENEVESTCESDGSYDLVVYCSVCGKELSRETVVVPALGHNYGEVTYTWANDNSSVTATRVCDVCGHIDTETVDTVSQTINPTCTTTGLITYTAIFINNAFGKQTKEVEVAALGHTEALAVRENEVVPTCDDAGSYDLVVYCSVCGEELSRDTIIVPALGHNYGEVTYTWSDDNLRVTATRVCQNDNSHIETETVATTSVTTNPTCTTTGLTTYTATFTNSAFITQTKEIEIAALGHIEALAVKENEVSPTCESDGSYDLVIYCEVCGEELSRETIIVPALGHTEAQAVKENEIVPTCEEAGSYDLVIYCSECGKELSRETVVVPALGHNYGVVTYTWSDDNSRVTATRICQNDNNHVETETVTTSYKITIAATCEETGILTYTAIFANPAFVTQTKEEEIAALGHKSSSSSIENEVAPTCESDGSYDVVVYCSVCGEELSRETIIVPALGHNYGEVTYTWANDNSRVTAARVCGVCGHIDTETVDTVSQTTNSTCTATGLVTYTAIFTNSAFSTQTKDVVIPALGHVYGEVTYVWTNDNSRVTATRVCQNDDNHIETETVLVTVTTIDPTCTATGLITYTAIFTNNAFATQTKEEEIPALGHTYGEVTYVWASDNSRVTASRVCDLCGHVDSETVETLLQTINPTCTSTGLITYQAVFENEAFATQTKEVEIPTLGHEYGTPTYTWSDDLRQVVAIVSCIHDSNHVITETVLTISEITTAPTCEELGVKTYRAVFANDKFETQIKEVSIPATGHDYTHYNLVPATCLETGMKEYYHCESCGKYFDAEYNEVTYQDLIIEALGHDYDYQNGTWEWSNDYSAATYKVICTHNASEVLVYDAIIESSITSEATCTASGILTYTAEVTVNGVTYTNSKTESIPSLGHEYDYQNGVWSWSDDYTQATISFICSHDSNHKDTYTATIKSTITINPTCEVVGQRTYTATVSLNGVLYTDTKIKEIDKVSHSYIHYDLVNPTCTDTGIAEYYVCSICGKYFDTDYNEVTYQDLIIEALGHEYDYQNGSWEWASDYSAATYTVFCNHDSNHKLIYNAVVSDTLVSESTHIETGLIRHTASVEINNVSYTNTLDEVLPMLHHETSITVQAKEPTCDEDGNILYYHCVECGKYFSDSSMTIEIEFEDTIIPSLGHTYLYHEEVLPTCESDGTYAYYTCTVCGKVFDINKNETILAELVIPSLGHTEALAVKENEVLPTCDTEGSYDLVVYCSVCGKELSREKVIVPSLGHTEALAVKENEVAPTCDTNGSYDLVVYCSVCGEELSREEIIVPSLGHTYLYHEEVLPTCENSGTYAYYTCTVCGKVFDINKNETTLAELVIPFIGHTPLEAVRENEVAPTCETEGSYDLVVYCSVCGEELSREKVIVPVVDHTYLYHEEVLPTCENSGTYAYYTCTVCGKVFDINKNEITLAELVIPALGHTEALAVKENEVLPTCDTEGSYDLVVYCSVCGEELSREKVVVPSLDHTYGEVTYVWSDDHSFVTASRECFVCGHVEEEVAITTTITVNPTCISDGNIKYTATFINSAFVTQTYIEILPAIGHDYVVTYTWSDDNRTVLATAICSHDSSHRISETVTTYSQVVLPTCDEIGSITYFAEFTDSTFETQVAVIDVPSLGHSEALGVRENEIAPTCKETGSYDLVVYCSVCGIELSRETVIVLATGHIEALAVRENEIAPTCESNGSYDLVVYCSECGEELSRETVVVLALGHTYIHHDAVAPTCSETGNYEYYTCSICGKYFDIDKNITTLEALTIAALGHKEAIAVKENEVLPTCDTNGSYDLVVYCTVCGIELSRETVVVPSLGHDYGEVTYEWSLDNSKVTAKMVCQLCGDIEEETVDTIVVTIDASCEATGLVTYTAEFNSSEFETKTKEIILAKLGHSYKSTVVSPTCDTEGYTIHVCERCNHIYYDNYTSPLGHEFDSYEWSWNNDYSEATITFICSHNNSHTETIHATITEKEDAPSCTLTGLITYTAIATYNGKTYKDTKTEVIEALGHIEALAVKENEVAPTCDTNGSYDLVVYCSVCGEELSRETLVIEALGHEYDYQNGSWEWASDYSAATYTVFCNHDSNHKLIYNAVVSDTLVSESTHIETGLIRHTATVEINNVSYTNTLDEVLPMLHHETSITVQAKEPTCDEDGNILYYHCVECGKYFSDSSMTIEIEFEDTIIPSPGHTYLYHEEVLPTCESDGTYAYYTCTVCGKVFDINKNETTLAELVIQALGHSYHEEVTLPTCENKGYTTYVCDTCGHTYIANYKDALGHSYHISYEWNSDNTKVTATATCSVCGNTITEVVDTLITTKPQSCKATGLVTYKAEFDNSLFETQVKEEVLEKLPHTSGDAVIENLVYATCDSEGSYDLVVYCTICHEELSRDTVTVPRLDHTYNEIVTLPTCEAEGYTTYICEFCGDSYVANYIPALGHSYHEEVTLPTCDTEGYTTYICDTCGHTYIANYKDALGHDYQITYVWNGNVSVTATAICKHNSNHQIVETVTTSSTTTLPTCINAGKTVYQAVFTNSIFDNQIKEVELDALGHTYKYVDEVLPTCEENGIQAHYVCEVCGTIFDINKNETTLAELVISSLGHSYQVHVTNPTCEAEGYTTYICEFCGDSYVANYIPALGHSYHEEVTLPTCEAEGYTTYVCDTCGHTYISNYKDALGHSYYVSYEWNSDNTKVAATATCSVCGKTITEVANASYTLIEEANCTTNGHGKYIVTFENALFVSQEKVVEIEALGHDISHHLGKDPTCTDAGYEEYDTCTRCDYTTIVVIPSLGHTPALAVKENEVAPTCDTNGSYDLVVYCSVCGEELSRTTKMIPMLGHSYQSHVTNPTCEEEGYTTHTCTRCGDSYIDNYTPALGHSYGEVTYSWSIDNKEVTASHACLRCGNTFEEVSQTTYEIIKVATCKEEGLIRYIATFNSFDTDTLDVTLPKISHTPASAVKENVIAPTCEANGSYDLVIYCSVCGEELSRESVIVPALGHNYDYQNGVWNWSNYSEAKYIVSCLNNDLEKEIYNAEITSIIVKAATDNETGLRRYIAKVNVSGFVFEDIKEEVIPTTSHQITVVYQIEPTCEMPGNITYYYCSNCDKYYSDALLTCEISFEETIIPPLGHDYISHPAKAPTCTEAGYDSYQTCTRCDYTTYTEIPALGHSFKELVVAPTCDTAGYTLHYCEYCEESYKDHYEDALGHDYKITYTWSADNQSVTAKATCTHDSSHVILEVSNTKSTILELVGCETNGKIKYSVTFTNPLFDNQTKEVTVLALGHKEGNMVKENIIAPTCEAHGSHDEVYYCSVCGEALSRTTVIDDALGHDLTYHEGLAPTCEEKGYNPYYSCERCGYSTYTEIPALGHTHQDAVIEVIEEATCLATGAHYEVYYCSECGKELHRDLVYDSALGHNYQEQVVLPTCTTQGYTIHTCQRCGRSYVDTYVAALGHDYSIYEYVWSSDYTYCDAYAYCSHDLHHVIHEVAYSSYKDMTYPTCDEIGLRIYTCEFTNIRFETQKMNVDIPSLGHTYGSVTYTWNEFNSIVTACEVCEVCGHVDKEIKSTTSIVIEPTCEENGLITYTVEFTNPAFEPQTKEVGIERLGHEYGIVTYTWNSDNSICTATRICNHNSLHIEEENSLSTHVTVLPTCEDNGLVTYKAIFENRAFETQIKEVVIDSFGHGYHYHSTIPATCLEDGVDEYYSCDRCDKIFDINYNEMSKSELVLEKIGHNYGAVSYTWNNDYSTCTAERICLNDHNHKEEETYSSTFVKVEPTCTLDGSITYTVMFSNPAFDTIIKTVILPALGHEYLEPVKENEVTPTCEVNGSYDLVVYCDVCGKELSRENIIVEPLGHDYSEVSYVWSQDYKKVTATRICNHDSLHIEEEVSFTTNVIIIPATCDKTGIIQYKAIFNNEAFNSQILNVTTEALGHEYGLWYLVSSPTLDSCGLIERACKHDASHKENLELPILNDIDYVYTVLTPATGAKDGLAEYHNVFNGVDITVYEVIDAYGFNYTYYNNNSIVATYHGYDGDSLIVPDRLDSYVVNGYLYYFNGWDKEIPSELHEDMKFYAKFIIAAVIYNDVIIEIPDSLSIDPSYRIIVEKNSNNDSIESKKNVLTSEDDYSDYTISNIFDIMFEKDGKNIELDDDEVITIKIKKNNISDLDDGTKLFYFDEDGNVKEISYYVDGEYVVFEMGKMGTIGFANDGFNWLWAVFIIQSMSIVMLLAVIVYRKKFKR